MEMVGEWGALQELSFLLLLFSQLPDGTGKEVTSSTGWGSGDTGVSPTTTIHRRVAQIRYIRSLGLRLRTLG